MMRKTKIVCTIGPASDSIEILKQLIENGMDVARLNFSHGTYEQHENQIKNIRQAAKEVNKDVAILLDTQGPEIRTKKFANGEARLDRGSTVYVSMNDVIGTEDRFTVTYKNLINDVEIGTIISLDDGLIALEVVEIDKEVGEIKTVVTNEGIIRDNKSVNVPNIHVKLPAITEKDEKDILFGIEQGVDFIAASFVQQATDVFTITKLLEKHNASHIQIISKIENQEGIDNFTQILAASYGIMVARGDLGVEIPAEDVPLVQKQLIRKCNLAGKPVITATQMLDSMQRNPRPTRAEASDVANAIFDGTDAIMLSGETAAGDYPVEAVQTMSTIALKTETNLDEDMMARHNSQMSQTSITDGISHSVKQTAMTLSASAIITPTESGYTARMISKYRPKVPIIAVTFSDIISRQLSLVWGVHPVISRQAHSIDELFDISIDQALRTDLVDRGSKVVITAGVPIGESGTTNLMKIHVIGDVIARGQGIGRRSAYGQAVIAKNTEEAIKKVNDGDILVAHGTNRDMMPAIEKAGGLVTEAGGLTSHAAVVGLSLGIPVIVGVDDALEMIKDGQDITIDGSKGDIYDGHASVL